MVNLPKEVRRERIDTVHIYHFTAVITLAVTAESNKKASERAEYLLNQLAEVLDYSSEDASIGTLEEGKVEESGDE